MTLKIQGLLATCTQLWSNISQSIMCIHEWCDQLILLHIELLTKEQVKLGLCTSVQRKLHGIPEVFLNRCLPVTWDSSVQLILIGFGSFPYWKSPDMSATFREKSLTKDHHHRTTFSSHIYLLHKVTQDFQLNCQIDTLKLENNTVHLSILFIMVSLIFSLYSNLLHDLNVLITPIQFPFFFLSYKDYQIEKEGKGR